MEEREIKSRKKGEKMSFRKDIGIKFLFAAKLGVGLFFSLFAFLTFCCFAMKSQGGPFCQIACVVGGDLIIG